MQNLSRCSDPRLDAPRTRNSSCKTREKNWNMPLMPQFSTPGGFMLKPMGIAVFIFLANQISIAAPKLNAPSCPAPSGSASSVFSVKLTEYTENGSYTEQVVCSGTPQVNLVDYRNYPEGCEESNPPVAVATCQFQFGSTALNLSIFAEMMYFNYSRFSLPTQDWKQAMLSVTDLNGGAQAQTRVQTYSITPNLTQSEFYLFGHPSEDLVMTDANGVKHYLSYVIDLKITQNP